MGYILLSLLATGAGAPFSPPAIPAPDFHRIDYRHPKKYLELPKALGKQETILQIAGGLKRADWEHELLAIRRWMHDTLRVECGHFRDSGYDPKEVRPWLTFDEIRATSTGVDCTEVSILLAALARGLGLPAVWVKTMDLEWVKRFGPGTPTQESWPGRVFVEVFAGGKWRLIDVEDLVAYDDYNPDSRLLPGNRWAYDKGGAPEDVVLPSDGARWRAQTLRYFGQLKVSELPMGQGVVGSPRPLVGTAFIMATSALQAQIMESWCGGQGIPSERRDLDNDARFEKRAGNWVILWAGDPDYPLWKFGDDVPVSHHDLAEALKKGAGHFERTSADGVHFVVLLGGVDLDTVSLKYD